MKTPLALVFVLALLLGACTGDDAPADGADTDGTDTTALATAFDDLARGIEEQQLADGIPMTPLGRQLADCPIADAAALSAIADGLGVADEGEVLSATLQDPGGASEAITCAIRFGESSAGAVVLNAAGRSGGAEQLRDELTGNDFEEVADASAPGLPDDEVLLFDATTFNASRAVWLAGDFQISVTANSDLAGTGALLDGLPVAVTEVRRVVEGG
jgi:hypothetical protein